jgi:Uma2 family endonuclease
VFNAPIDVILSPHDIVQPDLAVVTDPAAVTPRGIESPPLLVVEVISPSSIRHDRQLKARRYAALGIVHYWIVDVDQRSLECYRSDGDRYVAVARAEADTTLAHPDFPGLTIDTGRLWS